MELGLVTGMGLLLNLLADFSVLPSLTVLVTRRRKRENSGKEAFETKDLIRLNARSARRILSGAGILTLVCILSASQVWFDLHPLRLQTANAESVV
jgi:hypothetical protein